MNKTSMSIYNKKKIAIGYYTLLSHQKNSFSLLLLIYFIHVYLVQPLMLIINVKYKNINIQFKIKFCYF